jgi:hypothetical protein
MSKSNALETAMLAYIFTGTAPSWAAATELDLHLHTADPGEGSASTVNEATYTSYLPVTVDRAATDWTVTGDSATNDNLIQFPQCTGGTNTITHASVTPQGSTEILYIHALSSPLSVSNGIQPQVGPGDFDTTEG